ncbi:MAG TPA: sulfatase-like hydrolase/transferase [Terriglobales bacterium]|nr:sulfatase-like hydrolase/transferase [Terriglobales bacterium]
MKNLVFRPGGVLLILVSLGLPARATPATKAPPNVVLFTLDTLRADHLGCYGDMAAETPNLDRISQDGVRFAHAYTLVPITLPSHTVILTGTYPMRNGIHDFSGNRLNDTLPTLATVFRDRGYETAASIGSAVLDSRFGLNRGFEFYYDHFDFSRLDERNLDEMERPGNEVVDHALDWLKSHHQKPFLLWVHLYDAHLPYNLPPAYRSKYQARPYDGEIAFIDVQVGRVIKYLQSQALYKNTLVVVAGDHGESLGEHGEKTHGFFIYDATLRVPLLFKLPDSLSAPTKVVNEAANLADLMPTILDLLGIPKPAEVQGKSLVPEMQGKPSPSPPEEYAETYLPRIHFDWSELRSVRFRQYYFIDAPKPELYDTNTDPRELKNIYSQQRAIANELRKRLTNLIAQYSAKNGKTAAERTGLDPALTERLKSLGYVAVGDSSDEVISDRSLPDPKDRIQVYELVSDALSDSQHGRYVESVAKLLRAEKTEKDSIPIEYLLGLNYFRMNQYDASIEKFQTVVKLSPSYSLATFYLGLAYANAGDWNQSIVTLQKALELDGTNYSAAFNLGAAYLKIDKVDDAETAFRKSVAINPNYSQGYEALGEVLLFEGKTDDGIAALRGALAAEPRNNRARAKLIKALQAKGLNREAEEEMRKAGGTDAQP